jgi:hypothetical protein
MSDQVTDDVVDEMLAKAMLKLSFDERNAVNEELHGVKCLAIPENPEFLSRALEDFQREIDKTETNASSVSKKAYNMILLRREKEEERNRTRLVSSSDTTSIAAVSETVYTKNHYAIDDDDFRLRFLRVELFDVQKAVNRFLTYLKVNSGERSPWNARSTSKICWQTRTLGKSSNKDSTRFCPFGIGAAEKSLCVFWTIESALNRRR